MTRFLSSVLALALPLVALLATDQTLGPGPIASGSYGPYDNVTIQGTAGNPALIDSGSTVTVRAATMVEVGPESIIRGQFVAIISPNTPPTIVTPAAATPASIAVGGSTTLTVVAADDGGEPALIYQWSASGPGTVSFSVNGTNAAKTTSATFSQSGLYALSVTVTDAGGLSVTSDVSVGVFATAQQQDATASPLVVPTAFDAAQWASSSSYRATYLGSSEPGRVWQSAAPGSGAPAIAAVGPRYMQASPVTAVTLTLRAAANAPVSLLCNGDGYFFANRRNAITVQADATGQARVDVIAPTTGRTPIMAASPMCTGMARFSVVVP